MASSRPTDSLLEDYRVRVLAGQYGTVAGFISVSGHERVLVEMPQYFGFVLFDRTDLRLGP